ncbi:MAG: homoserine dehydrogenase [Armatimonadetes bacterium]|nr:homoserine dehydrogenase [Armatimonadota bacterium]
MLGVLDELRDLTDPIRIAVVGAGAMGLGLVRQIALTPGLTCVGVADLRLDRAEAAALATGRPYQVCDSAAQVHGAIGAGRMVVCADGRLLAAAAGVEVLLEASSAVLNAAETALTAVRHGQHLVLMNAEIDAAFGPVLAAEAAAHGVVMTGCDGDQHGVLKRLWDEVVLWGFEPVMAGNQKGFLDRYANPTTIVPEADKRRLDYRMCTAYTDGSKLNIEMSLLANGLGLTIAQPGMLGPRAAHVHEAFDRFDLAALRGTHGAVADYLLGAEPGGGVFVIGYCDDPYQADMLAYYKLGDGPFYLFYRPYHLCHLEVAGCVLLAARHGRALLAPRHGLRTQVIAYAKRPLRAGERLDGLGGYTCYGQIELTAAAKTPGLPIILADDVVLARDIAQDERLAWTDADMPDDRLDVRLHRASLALTPGSGA